jgi:PIN domain nuclease of toxin-antitoxin system
VSSATIKAIADTQAIIWYVFSDKRLSKLARDKFEQIAKDGDYIGVSAISFVEIVYLTELGRIHPDTMNRLLQLLQQPDPLFVPVPFDLHAAYSLGASVDRATVPDMPDRMIAATAVAHSAPLITSDTNIQKLTTLTCIW